MRTANVTTDVLGAAEFTGRGALGSEYSLYRRTPEQVCLRSDSPYAQGHTRSGSKGAASRWRSRRNAPMNFDALYAEAKRRFNSQQAGEGGDSTVNQRVGFGLAAMREAVLPPSLVDRHGNRVGQIQAARPGAHGDAQAALRP